MTIPCNERQKKLICPIRKKKNREKKNLVKKTGQKNKSDSVDAVKKGWKTIKKTNYVRLNKELYVTR